MLDRIFHFWDRTTFYLHKKVFYAGVVACGLFVISFFVPALFTIGLFLLAITLVSVLVDALLLYSWKGIGAERILPARFSNGDENKIIIRLSNLYPFKAYCKIIDELPFQFQARDWKKYLYVDAGETKELVYFLKPVERGEYHFNKINIYADGPLKLVSRRFVKGNEQIVKVYPSYKQMRHYSLAAVANIQQTGVKRMRKLGHSMEFEQIKEYVRGDDYRTINWKATARKGDLMVNNFTDERSQQIYCLINKGRIMKMPFGGMTLLDYAINTSLVLCNVALQKHDKAGLIAFSQQIDAFIPADKKPTQINLVLETLYKQKTAFLEPDMEKLFSTVRNRITHRSLLVMFTNFESLESLERELPTLKRLAHYHLLLVIFFDNTELKQLIDKRVSNTEDIYIKTIAEKHRYEKQLIVKELQKNGIIALLSSPQDLSINALNKYLELKNRNSI